MPVPTVDIIVPSDPVYEGTSQTLTCNVTLPPSVDTDVNITVNWGPEPLSSDRVTIHQPSALIPPFISTLIISPVGMNESGQYSCEATASSSSEYIAPSSSGNSLQQNLTVTGKSLTIYCMYHLLTTVLSSFHSPASSKCPNILIKPDIHCW